MGIFGRKKVTDSSVENTDKDTWTPPLDESNKPPTARSFRVDEYRQHVLNAIKPLNPSAVSLLDAVGLTLNETIRSDLDLPLLNLATVTGYAINITDTLNASDTNPIGLRLMPVESKVNLIPPALEPMSALRVVAGAPLPKGANTVIPDDQATVSNNLLILAREPLGDQNIHRQGTDLSEGDVLARSGEILTPTKLALIAESGVGKVLVQMHPRIVIFNCVPNSVSPGVPLTNIAERYAATTVLLASAAEDAGAEVYVVAAPSDPELLSKALEAQLIRADLVITVGGRDKDGILNHVPETYGCFADIDLNLATHQGLAQLGEMDTPWLMVPGDLYGAFLSFQHFIRPAIRKLAGLDPMEREHYDAQILSNFFVEEGRNCVLGVATNEGVTVVGDPNRPLAKDIARANCLIVLPENTRQVLSGFVSECWMLTEPGK